MKPKIRVVGKTDKGLVRAGNEDSFHLDTESNVFAVCDGMGGHQAGEVASMTASDTIEKTFRCFYKKLLDDPDLGLDHTLPPGADVLAKSIRLANRTICNRAAQDSELGGMGTTIVAVAFEADVMSLAHVGDSRAYRLDEEALIPLTRDHSWVVEMQDSQKLSAEEANSLVAKNVITRALGVKESVAVDLRIMKVKPGDIFILCSDGLCGFADDDEIFPVAAKQRDNLAQMADDLIGMANDRGGNDNTTVVIMQIDEVEESALPETDVFTLDHENQSVLEAEDAWVTRLSETFLDEDTDEQTALSEGKSSKLLLFSLFALFAIVAVVIIYFSQMD